MVDDAPSTEEQEEPLAATGPAPKLSIPAHVVLPEWPDASAGAASAEVPLHELPAQTAEPSAPTAVADAPDERRPTPAPDEPPVAAEPPTARSRAVLYTAAALALGLVALLAVLIVSQDEPGPDNKHARAACREMARVSNEIIERKAVSFTGRLDVVLRHARAAAREDPDYELFFRAVQQLDEDPEVASATGSDAVDTIAESCR